MESELLRMPRRGLPADDHLSLNLLNDEIADPSVRELANLRFDPFDQASARCQAHLKPWCHSWVMHN